MTLFLLVMHLIQYESEMFILQFKSKKSKENQLLVVHYCLVCPGVSSEYR
jgi:hypothetical protein